MTRAIPIIMSGPMVRALRAGHKTETRRMLYAQRKSKNGVVPKRASQLTDYPPPAPIDVDHHVDLTGWHKAQPGDLLWVRENVLARRYDHLLERARTFRVEYSADQEVRYFNVVPEDGGKLYHADRKSIPSIHMPRFANRIVIELTAVKIERLQLITRREALREGIIKVAPVDSPINDPRPLYALSTADPVVRYTPVERYAELWTEINGETGPARWQANPWVVALTGKVHLRNIDAVISERTPHEPAPARPSVDLFGQRR